MSEQLPPKNTLENIKNKPREMFIPLLLALASGLGIFVGSKLKSDTLISKGNPKNEVGEGVNTRIGEGRVEEILRYIDAKYVEEVDNRLILDNAVNGLLNELDPHSNYIPASELKNITEDLEGEFEGVGIETLIFDDTLTVVSAIASTPAAAVGILTGDKIIRISDSSAIGKDLNWVNGKLRGKRGSNVKLEVFRPDERKIRIFNVTRDRIPIHSIEVATTLNSEIGYIKISRFAANTDREFIQALEKLYEKKQIKDIVIDLRGNPGGYMDKAVALLSQVFKEKDKLVVFTKGRTVHRNEYKTSGRQRYPVRKVAVLIDEGSASASEIVAGAIQDWDRGVVIGRRSFGKGLVQESYGLKDGSELRLTVARYFTPTGRSIQKPYNELTKKQYAEEEKRRLNMGELEIADSIKQFDKTPFKTANGRIVFSNGGITPDIFVPIEVQSRNEYFLQLKPWAKEFAYRYYLNNRTTLKFKEWQDFQQNFKIADYTFNDFIRYTERKGIQKQSAQVERMKPQLKQLLKAHIVRQLHGDEGYFGIFNENDPCIARALEALGQEDPLGLRKLAFKTKQ
jgi:carboxyl-terminal processing protease